MLLMKKPVPFGREELSAIQDRVRAEALGAGLDTKSAANLVFVVEEIGANILVHSGATWMEVKFEATQDGGSLLFRDDGEEFDPIEASQLMDQPVISEFVSGHLGLWILKRLPMVQTWQRVAGVNELRFDIKRS